MLDDSARKRAAQEAFGTEDSINKEVLASEARRTEVYGGVEGGWIEDLTAENQLMAKNIVETVYPVFLKRVREKGAENATDLEITTKILIDKLKRSDQINDPKEQAQMYAFMKNLELELADDEFKKQVEGQIKSDVNRKRGERESGPRFDSIDDFLADQAKLKEDIFYNMTGNDPEASFRGTGLMAKVGNSEGNWVRRAVEAQYRGLKVAKELVKEKGKVVGLGQYLALSAMATFGEGHVFKEQYDVQLAKHRKSMFEARQGEFSVEKKMDDIAVTALECSKMSVADHLRTTVKSKIGDNGWLPITRSISMQVDSFIVRVESASDQRELDRVVKEMEDMHRTYGAGVGADSIKTEYEKVRPQRAAEALVLEELMAEEYDAMAREALRRELPKSESSLKGAVDSYELEIARLNRVDTKKMKPEQVATHTEQIEKLKAKKELAKQALLLADENTGEMGRFFRTDMKTIEVRDLTERMPVEAGTRARFEAWLGNELDVDFPPAKDPLGASVSDGERKKRHKSGMEAKLRKMDKFSVAGLLFKFMGVELV